MNLCRVQMKRESYRPFADQMMGESAITIIPQENREHAEKQFHHSLHTGEVIEFEFEHRDSQGNRRILAATIAPIVSQTS